jgi:enamine deaminase RidA (YjgF/YER057c/UK114 family)
VSGYAQVTQAYGISRVVWVSGQIPIDAAGNLPTTFAEQARNAWRNVIAQLDNVNLSIDNLAKVTIYLADRKYALENRQIRQEILGDRKVAMTVVIAGIFDENWLLEIEAVAAE